MDDSQSDGSQIPLCIHYQISTTGRYKEIGMNHGLCNGNTEDRRQGHPLLASDQRISNSGQHLLSTYYIPGAYINIQFSESPSIIISFCNEVNTEKDYLP